MKRWLVKAVVFLLLGAIVNVAVAWVCTLWSRVELTVTQVRVKSQIDWASERLVDGQAVVDIKEPARWEWHWTGVGFGVNRTIIDAPDKGSNETTSAGLPMRSLQYGTSRKRGSLHISGAIQLPSSFPETNSQHGLLPYRPIWPGFAVNTMFYAAILWLLSLAPPALRRAMRRRRGRCIKCGYDLRGAAHDARPECGARFCQSL